MHFSGSHIWPKWVKPYRYTGMERDDESGLSYHNARYYIPWLCRWMNPDPIGIGDGVNVYAYCKNDPIGNTDKKGTQTKESENKKLEEIKSYPETISQEDYHKLESSGGFAGIPWNVIEGWQAHMVFTNFYRAEDPGEINWKADKSISGKSELMRPDLRYKEGTIGGVWELKPNTAAGKIAAAAEVKIYTAKLKAAESTVNYGPGSTTGAPNPKGFIKGTMTQPNPYQPGTSFIYTMDSKNPGVLLWDKAGGQEKQKQPNPAPSSQPVRDPKKQPNFVFKDAPKLQPIPQIVPSAPSYQGITPIDQDHNLPLTNDPYKIIDKLAPVIIGGALLLAPELLPAIAPATPFLRPVLLSL